MIGALILSNITMQDREKKKKGGNTITLEE